MPREPRPFSVLSFASTHLALDAEAALHAAALDVVPIPTPERAGSLCGISLRIPPEQLPAARQALDAAGVVISSAIEILDV